MESISRHQPWGRTHTHAYRHSLTEVIIKNQARAWFNKHLEIVSNIVSSSSYNMHTPHSRTIDRFNYRAWHYKISCDEKIGSHFVGQKENYINDVSFVIQYWNQVFENDKQLINIDIEYLLSFSRYN